MNSLIDQTNIVPTVLAIVTILAIVVGLVFNHWSSKSLDKKDVGSSTSKNRLHDLDIDRISGNLTVKNLDFSYPARNRMALKDISVTLKEGTCTAIIGPCGSGKTTLLEHLAGVSSNTEDKVWIGGIPTREIIRSTAKSAIGFLPDNVGLSEGTIEENITSFATGFSRQEVYNTLERVGIMDYLQRFELGLDQPVGPGGRFVARGEQTIIGLAKIAFQNPSFVFLDEPNAYLDAHGEQVLFGFLNLLKKEGKTIVIVTHKANLLTISDYTLMLVNGFVEKFGPTRELFAQQQKTRASDTEEQASDTEEQASDTEEQASKNDKTKQRL